MLCYFYPLRIVSKRNELLKVSYRLRFPALFFVGSASAVVGIFITGVEAYGFVEVLYATFSLTKVTVG